MFLKRFTFLAIFATVFSAAQAQKLDATFDLVRFKATDSQNMVELYCSVNGNSVIYKKVPGGFQASVALDVQVSDSVGIKYADKMLLKSPLVTDTTKFQLPFNLQKRLFLKNGNYTVLASAKDINNTAAASQLEIPLAVKFKKEEIQFSDVQLLDSYQKTTEKNDYTKSGYKLVSYVSNFYPKGLNQLKFYTEIYNAENALGKDKPMVIFYRLIPASDNLAKLTIAGQKILKTAPVNVFLQDLDISTLTSGNYELTLELRNAENKVIATQHRLIQRSNPMNVTETLAAIGQSELPDNFANLDSTKLSLYVLSLAPVANANENSFIATVAKSGQAIQQKNYLYAFWKKRSEANPEQAWIEYKKRIDFVEKNYANKTFHGYETDRGRVFLQYGAPNKISTERDDVNRAVNNADTKPYQIWHYYQLEKDNQRNRVFVFLQKNLGNNNYALVHSTATGEISDNEWRKQATRRFGNVDRYSSQQDRKYDREGNEIVTPNSISTPNNK